MDDRVTPAVITIALLLLLLALMYLGFRLRQRRQRALPRPKPVPESPGVRSVGADLFYVATTVENDPLDRIAVAGLGFRARASLAVFDGGIALGIAGEPDAWIPAADIVGVDRSTWTIDRVVEPGGLLRLTWTLGDTVVDSYLRAEASDQQPLMAAIENITTGAAAEVGSDARTDESEERMDGRG